jgi:hypothetical protein
MAREAQGRRALGPRHALFGAGSVLLLCALIGTLIHPEPAPELAALQRSDGVSSSVGEGPQLCGPRGPAIGHAGSWVIELWIDGREHCVVAYPKSESERQLLSSLPTRTSLTAWHSATMVWQIAGPGGVLIDHATRRAEAEAALSHHRARQGVLLGAGLAACALSLVLSRRARRSRPGDVARAHSNRMSRGTTR